MESPEYGDYCHATTPFAPGMLGHYLGTARMMDLTYDLAVSVDLEAEIRLGLSLAEKLLPK